MRTTSSTSAMFHTRALVSIIALVMLASVVAFAQETRSTILGTVKDQSGAVVAGATVDVTNTDTNTTTKLSTNSSGYFEAPYLLPGVYSITVTAQGFKKYVQQGYTLTVNSRQNLDIALEIGAATESVTVTATAPLLETTSGSGTASLEQRQISDLPVMSNSAILLARGAPGIQWTAQPNYLGMHSNVGGSAVSAAGGVGGNEFALDGVPNLARRTPHGLFAIHRHSRRIQSRDRAVRRQQRPHDQRHDLAFDQERRQRLSRPAHLATLAAASERDPEHDQCRSLGAHPAGRSRRQHGARRAIEIVSPQPPGRSNNWAGSAGGPVRVPWLYNGRDKLFFFFGYNAAKDVKTEEANAVNRTVPADAHRRGDFSRPAETRSGALSDLRPAHGPAGKRRGHARSVPEQSGADPQPDVQVLRSRSTRRRTTSPA